MLKKCGCYDGVRMSYSKVEGAISCLWHLKDRITMCRVSNTFVSRIAAIEALVDFGDRGVP